MDPHKTVQYFRIGDLVFSLREGIWYRWDAAQRAFVSTSITWDVSVPGLVPVDKDEALARTVAL